MLKIVLQEEPLDINRELYEMGVDADGAIVTFIGMVRNKSDDQDVMFLEYEIYECMAKKEIEKIAKDAISRWSLSDCIINHRYGRVEIGEASVFIAVSSPHRDEAFKAARYIIDTIKKTVPIWKKEFLRNDI
ncbi:MAG: molybdenum cofactor biosynthesis protein MoaE [Spirochaetota bacterium]|nr:molybdenum cofactor biosynthesis protein MoaE [Spirochaetota bacterium]